MKALSDAELRSLASLLDDSDPGNLDLISRQILSVGEPILPYLEELRAQKASEVVARAEKLARHVRFGGLKKDFTRLAASPNPDLEEGAWLVCRFGYSTFSPDPYTQWLDRVAGKIREDSPPTPDALFQKINWLLFHHMGFAGNREDYYNPDNSYLHRVIETRRGIPLSLSVLYLLVAKRVGLPVFGAGLPGHFMLGLRGAFGLRLLDVFGGGRLLDVGEAQRLLLRNGYELKPQHLEPATARDMLLRMLRNLISIHQKAGDEDTADMLSGLAEIFLTSGPPLLENLR
ncbi:MAG TPA: transglutaminase-like domain-containing protein [Elusimicrobiota bacterium]|nr:transglutaminase-like domain-containing protein [Elusimicrobiota bacterium]